MHRYNNVAIDLSDSINDLLMVTVDLVPLNNLTNTTMKNDQLIFFCKLKSIDTYSFSKE